MPNPVCLRRRRTYRRPTIAITGYAASVFQSQGHCSAFHARAFAPPLTCHLSRRFFLPLFSFFPLLSPLRNEKVFSIFATDRIVQLNGCSLGDRSSFRGCVSLAFVAGEGEGWN